MKIYSILANSFSAPVSNENRQKFNNNKSRSLCFSAQKILNQKKTTFAQNSNNPEKLEKVPLWLGGAFAIGCAAVALLAFRQNKAGEIAATKIRKTVTKSAKSKTKKETSPSQTPKAFAKELAESLAAYTGKKVAPENLSCVLNKDEFLQVLKSLKKENYIASKENIQNGVFQADLHSHSVHSDGVGEVKEILNQVAQYADRLNQKNGKKFIFALTDHDTISGVKESLVYISENPQKFKNVNFVTGSEISYTMKADKTNNPCECSEMLVYGFNPFSKKVNSFFNTMRKRRYDTITNYINDLSKTFPDVNFSEKEYFDVFLNKPNYKPTMNFYWDVYNYGKIKKATSDIAKKNYQNENKYFNLLVSSNRDARTLYQLLKKTQIEYDVSRTKPVDVINNKYRPFVDSRGEINTCCENKVEDIVSTFGEDKNAFAAFAHPFYFTERIYDVKTFVKNTKEKMGELLLGSESYHQAYAPHLRGVDEINQICEREGLIPLGGRDNHERNWLDFYMFN